MDVAGKRVLVVGLGASGFAAARALGDLGARVRVTDDASTPPLEERAAALAAMGMTVELGGRGGSPDVDLALVSPGIPPHAPVLARLRKAGVPLLGEIELAYHLARCDLLAVTGTNGKTTTTSLLASMLAEAGIQALAAGNIGLPLVDAVARIGPGGAIAAELSSFQLAYVESFHARCAVLLNIAEDHTDWHGSFEDYVEAKAKVVLNQTAADTFVYNADDERAVTIAAGAASRGVPFSARNAPDEGIGIAAGSLRWRGQPVCDIDDISLPGVAGLEDVAAAAGAALSYGVPIDAAARAIAAFEPLGHRLAPVREIDGVSFIDDSKATNPHATLVAVQGMTDVVLIAGGRAKGIDLSVLADTVPPVVGVVALGEASQQIADSFSGLVPVARVSSMRAAVRAAREMAIAKGSVLLSPACASLDMYNGYAERGDDFVAAVHELEPKETRRDGDR